MYSLNHWPINVRLSPNSGVKADMPEGPRRAKSRHWPHHRYAVYELIHTMMGINNPMTPAFPAKTVAVTGIPTLNCALSIPSGIEITAG